MWRVTTCSECPPIWSVMINLAMIWTTCSAKGDHKSNLEEEIAKSTADVLRMRGYTAEEHNVTTSDGYILQLVEAGNPLVSNAAGLSNKEVVLFLHGTIFNATCYIVDTNGASPKDYSAKNAGQMSEEELKQLYQGDSNGDSLVLMLLDFGHQVFLLNRRSTIHSQGHVSGKGGQTSKGTPDGSAVAKALLDPTNPKKGADTLEAYFKSIAETTESKYWDFSLDEEAEHDVPEIVDFILKRTGRDTLAAVGWSSGGAIIEMALIEHPELNEKISKALLWSPALYLGQSVRDKLATSLLYPILIAYTGPVLPQLANSIISHLSTEVCASRLAKDTICQLLQDAIAGFGGDKEQVKPGFFSSFPAPVSSHHFAQLGQAAFKAKMHKYDHGPVKNGATYGAPTPPLYDVSKITSPGLYFWGAAHDGLVNSKDVANNVKDLKVKAELKQLDEPGVFFNHLSFMFHKDKSELLLIPCLKILES